ncbi:hypothetical protein N7451_012893 [Penicillium sp. IBT 35674x]|nr:hypothetical protein N7451_012893 [Penicillium sp. IBT 35674x]
MDSEEQTAPSVAAIKMESQQDDQQGYTRQADLRLELDEFTSLASRGRSGSTGHLSRPVQSPSAVTSVVAISAAGLRVVSTGFAEADANPGKRSAKAPGGVQKRKRNSDLITEGSDDLQPATQEILPKRPSSTSTIDTGLIYDTVQYLQTVTDLINRSNTVPKEGWKALQSATQLLQHRYEGIAAAVGAEDPDDVRHGTSTQLQHDTKCEKCADEEEDYLYD